MHEKIAWKLIVFAFFSDSTWVPFGNISVFSRLELQVGAVVCLPFKESGLKFIHVNLHLKLH